MLISFHQHTALSLADFCLCIQLVCHTYHDQIWLKSIWSLFSDTERETVSDVQLCGVHVCSCCKLYVLNCKEIYLCHTLLLTSWDVLLYVACVHNAFSVQLTSVHFVYCTLTIYLYSKVTDFCASDCEIENATVALLWLCGIFARWLGWMQFTVGGSNSDYM